jgi:hypothetical protein
VIYCHGAVRAEVCEGSTVKHQSVLRQRHKAAALSTAFAILAVLKAYTGKCVEEQHVNEMFRAH